MPILDTGFVKIINIYKFYMEAKKRRKKEKHLMSDMHTNIGIVLKFFYYMKPMHSRAYQTCDVNILYVYICTFSLWVYIRIAGNTVVKQVMVRL